MSGKTYYGFCPEANESFIGTPVTMGQQDGAPVVGKVVGVKEGQVLIEVTDIKAIPFIDAELKFKALDVSLGCESKN